MAQSRQELQPMVSGRTWYHYDIDKARSLPREAGGPALSLADHVSHDRGRL
jgi:hypothetical protein